MKIMTVVGARPQIIKSAAVTHKITESYSQSITEILVHTGQHYDTNMSDGFFEELGIPAPAYNLGIGSASHGKQTGDMLAAIETTLESENPDCVLIYGDTNSTVAAALAAIKLEIPVAHVEAGMRSFNKTMPEEVNRVLSDHASTFLFCPTRQAIENLKREGFTETVEILSPDTPAIANIGDVMYDNALRFSSEGESEKQFGKNMVEKDSFVLATLHRASNTQSKDQVMAILEMFSEMALEHNIDFLLALHPRTAHILDENVEGMNHAFSDKGILFTNPLGYKDIIWSARNARLVVTDSGGLQKEAAFFNTPSVVLRTETEWVELVECGLVALSSSKPEEFDLIFEKQLNTNRKLPENLYGDGDAAGKILEQLINGLR
jgi:UDP-GlcNAc3NAcA epimerase